MSVVDDPRTERVLTTAATSIARVLDARQRHAVVLALEVCSYIVAAFPSDEAMTPVELVRLLRRFAGAFEDVEDDDGDE